MARATPSSGVINVQVRAWFDSIADDFQLTQATPAIPFFPPLSLDSRFTPLINHMKNYSQKEIDQILNNLRNDKINYFAHMATEASATSSGLSNVVNMAARGAATIKGIPFLSSLTSSVTPIANSILNLKSAFGHSKPNNELPTKPLKIHPASSNVNCDNTQTSHTLAVQMLNSVTTIDGSYGSSTDDLSFAKIYRHPNFIQSISVSTASPPGNVLTAIPMDGFFGLFPNFSSADTILADLTLPHQAYVLFLFEYWLAQIVIDVYLFGCQMQSVKLRFAVVPGHYSPDPSGLRFDDSNSIVVQFGMNHFHQVKFPEVTNRNFLQNRFSNFATLFTSSQDPSADNCLGYLFILVEVPLTVTSDIVPPTINGIIEVHFADARFMTPLDMPIMPTLLTVPGEVSVLTPPNTPDSSDDESPPSTFYAHSMYTNTPLVDTTKTIIEEPSVSHNMDAPKINNAAYASSAGEVILSLKQFLTQYTRPFLVTTGIFDVDGTFAYNPYDTYYFSLTGPNAFPDKIDYLTCPFAFRKGSVHVRLFNSSTSNYAFYSFGRQILRSTRFVFVGGISTANPLFSQTRIQPVVNALEGISDLHLPYYQPFHIVRNQPANSTLISSNFSDPRVLLFSAYADAPCSISRCVGDDFSAGYLMGLPIMTAIRSADATLPPYLLQSTPTP